MKKKPHFRIIPNAPGPGWPHIWCPVRGDLGCLFTHAKAAAYRAESLAARLGLCPRKLRREFQEAFGASMKHWLVEVRSVEVRRRLRGEESIEEIARSVGFSHSKELSREFLQIYHIKPSDYRKQERIRDSRLGFESGVGSRESGVGSRESGGGRREAGLIFDRSELFTFCRFSLSIPVYSLRRT